MIRKVAGIVVDAVALLMLAGMCGLIFLWLFGAV